MCCLFQLLAPLHTCPNSTLGPAVPPSVPQEADHGSWHHLGSLAGWLPAGLDQWEGLTGSQMMMGGGWEEWVFFSCFLLLHPPPRSVPESGHSSPAPALTRLR